MTNMKNGQTNLVSAVDEVTSTLLERIVDGRWSEARIPTERELVDELNTSRASIRTAIDRLKTWNILEARQGSGTTVQPRVDWRIGAVPSVIRVLVKNETWDVLGTWLLDAIGLRRAIVLDMLQRAAATPGSPALNRSRQATWQAWEARTERADFLRRDHLILATLLEEVGLQITLSLINEIRRTYEVGVLLVAGEFRVPENYVETHISMLDAVGRGDGDAARRHFEDYLNALDVELVQALPPALSATLIRELGEAE